MSEVHFWQFKEIYETAHGVAHQDIIIKLVTSYLSFDQYAEVSQKEFYNILEVCLLAEGRSL